MVNFLQTLLSKDESEIDSAIVCGLLSLVAMILMTGYVVFVDRSMWNPLNFATGTATIIGSVAGGKTVRDRFSQPAVADNDGAK